MKFDTEVHGLNRLRYLLTNGFNSSHLRRVMSQWYGGALLNELPGPHVSHNEQVEAVLDTLRRQGRLDRRFFQKLCKELPARTREIAVIERLFSSSRQPRPQTGHGVGLLSAGHAPMDLLTVLIADLLGTEHRRARELVLRGKAIGLIRGLSRQEALAHAARLDRIGAIASFTSVGSASLPQRQLSTCGVILTNLGNLLVQTTTVTQRLYETILGRTEWERRAPALPANFVSRDEALQFCKILTQREQIKERPYRLPTEVEWERVARAGECYRFAGGNTWGAVAWAQGTRLQPVGQRAPNGWGLYDLSGNVHEWTASTNNDGFGLLKGGAYDSELDALMVEARQAMPLSTRDCRVGFRLVR